jgi:hypothetical protein
MTTNQIQIVKEVNSKNIRIICGYPGIGKSFLSKLNDNFIDIDSYEFSHIIDEDSNEQYNPEFPNNYYKYICNVLSDNPDSILLCSTHDSFRDLLSLNGIKYLLLIPKLKCKKEYILRYNERKSSLKWIEKISKSFNAKIIRYKIENIYPNLKDQLDKGETLEYYLFKFGLL